LATVATGLVAGVAVDFATGIGAALVAATGTALVPATGTAGEPAPAGCETVPLAAGTDVDVEVPAPGVVAAGAQGAALAVLVAGALGAAGAAAFFFPKSDPRLEKAAAAFETAVFAPAAV
jgi:hypothetical protein